MLTLNDLLIYVSRPEGWSPLREKPAISKDAFKQAPTGPEALRVREPLQRGGQGWAPFRDFKLFHLELKGNWTVIQIHQLKTPRP